MNNRMPCHNWSIKIWYLWSRKISQDNTQYNRKYKNEDSTFDLGFSLKLFHIWSRCPKLLLSLLIYKLFSEVRARLALTSQQECLEKWIINNQSVWMSFFEFLIDWKSSNTFLKAFLQPGKTTEIHRPAAQSEDTKNFILQTSSRPGPVNYPFSGNNPAQVLN